MNLNKKVVISSIDTSKLKVLKEKENIELINLSKTGDKEARDRLISGNLKLVLSVTGRFSGRGENADDLFQVGVIGLIKSIDNFDTSIGFRFSTYAVPMIIGEIRRYLRDNNPIKVSRSIRDLAYKVLIQKEAFLNEHQREPTIKELSEIMEIETESIIFALDAMGTPASLYEPIYNDNGDSTYLMDMINSKESQNDWLFEIGLKNVLDSLSQREKQIVELRFLKGLTQMDTAKIIGISQAQVSRLEKGAMDRIKNEA